MLPKYEGPLLIDAILLCAEAASSAEGWPTAVLLVPSYRAPCPQVLRICTVLKRFTPGVNQVHCSSVALSQGCVPSDKDTVGPKISYWVSESTATMPVDICTRACALQRLFDPQGTAHRFQRLPTTLKHP